jgi:multiple antibiotic resistance protein
METFLLAFISLFVAIDVFGVLPLYVGITEGMGGDQRRELTLQATMTAFVISVVFLVAGKLLFSFLGITESDFRVGGGIVLLVLAVYDLLFSADTKRAPEPTTDVVPLGIPLIMGPAALTTIIYLVHSHGHLWALGSLLASMLLVWLVFSQAGAVTKVMGEAGSKAFAKVAALFLTGIAVMMVGSGIEAMIRQH